MKLNGKVAVMTGASRGIGKAIVTRLASEGAIVAINYREYTKRLSYSNRKIMVVSESLERTVLFMALG